MDGYGSLGLGRTAAYEVDASGPSLCLVIVCGQNQKLKETLEAHEWENPAFIYGFTREMPDFM